MYRERGAKLLTMGVFVSHGKSQYCLNDLQRKREDALVQYQRSGRPTKTRPEVRLAHTFLGYTHVLSPFMYQLAIEQLDGSDGSMVILIGVLMVIGRLKRLYKLSWVATNGACKWIFVSSPPADAPLRCCEKPHMITPHKGRIVA